MLVHLGKKGEKRKAIYLKTKSELVLELQSW